MHLVMFDIDGTLTETMKVDEECFVRSFKDVFGFADINTDWSHYPRTTDSGIFHDVFTSRIGRSPTAQETSQFRQHFIQLLAAASSQSPFTPVAGADRLLSRLAQGGSHRVSLATGGWRDSARLKMASAGMCFDDHPAASADDALDRESIIRLSRQRAAERYGSICQHRLCWRRGLGCSCLSQCWHSVHWHWHGQSSDTIVRRGSCLRLP